MLERYTSSQGTFFRGPHLLFDHMNRFLCPAFRNHGNNTRIHDLEVLRTVNLQIRIHNTLLDVLGKSTYAICV
jgi:hypothetical protein